MRIASVPVSPQTAVFHHAVSTPRVVVSVVLQVLGWEAQLDIDDICTDAWRYQRNNPTGFSKS